MAFVYGDRVKETSLSSGIGVMALGGPAVGFRSFAIGVGVGNQCFYGIVNTADNSWEMGRGTIGFGTLTRDVVLSSSNSNLLVNLTAGQKVVYTTVPDQFYASRLDDLAHQGIDHTIAPFNLMNASAHTLIDHTASPFNLLATANLGSEHALIDHKSAPFNLLDSAAHALVDHKAAPFNLLDSAAHASINHYGLITSVIPQVTGPEKTAGTSTFLRSFAPLDIAAMAATHAPQPLTVDRVRAVLTTRVSITGHTPIPTDDTKPQITEGAFVVQASITPKKIGNKIAVRASVQWNGFNNSGVYTTALFEAGNTSAFAATARERGSSNIKHSTCEGEYTATALAPLTFSVRLGSDIGGGSPAINGDDGGSPLFDLVPATWIELLEYNS